MSDLIELVLSISETEADVERLDAAARNLLEELKELPLESVSLQPGEALPEGAKGADPALIGAIAVAVLPNALPKLTEFLQAWVLQGRGRQIKFKGKIAGRSVEYEGSLAELEKLLELMEKKNRKR